MFLRFMKAVIAVKEHSILTKACVAGWNLEDRRWWHRRAPRTDSQRGRTFWLWYEFPLLLMSLWCEKFEWKGTAALRSDLQPLWWNLTTFQCNCFEVSGVLLVGSSPWAREGTSQARYCCSVRGGITRYEWFWCLADSLSFWWRADCWPCRDSS